MLLLVVALAGIALGVVAYFVKRFDDTAQDGAQVLFAQIVGRHAEALQTLTEGSQRTLRLLSVRQVDAGRLRASGGRDDEFIGLLSRVVNDQPSLYGIYVGLDDNSFLQVIGLREDARQTQAWDVPPDTYFAVRYIDGQQAGERREHWRYLARDGRELAARQRPTVYRPSERLWFEREHPPDQTLLTEPYLFESSGAPGMTFSRRLANGAGTIAIDVSLGQLDAFMADTFGDMEGGAVISDGAGRVLARHLSGGFALTPPALMERRLRDSDLYVVMTPEGDAAGGSDVLRAGGEPHVYVWRRLTVAPGTDFHLSAFAPMRLFTASLIQPRHELVAAGLALLAAVLALVYWAARRLRRRLARLTTAADRARQLDFSVDVGGPSMVYEIDNLSQAMRSMQVSLRTRTGALESAAQRLQALVQHGLQASAGHDAGRVARQTVGYARALAGADAGLLCLVDAQGHWRWFGEDRNQPTPEGGRSHPAPPCEEAVQWVMRAQRSRVWAPEPGDAPAGPAACWPGSDAQQPGHVLLVPLGYRRGRVLGVLLLIRHHSGEPAESAPAWDLDVISCVELLAMQSAMALAHLGWPHAAGTDAP